MINIPKYRAKKKDGDYWVEGYYVSNRDNTNHWIRFNGRNIEIDPKTLSIHFPNTFKGKIFFSIKTYLGGDEIKAKFYDGSDFKGIALFNGVECRFYDKNDDWVSPSKLRDIEVIGIHK